jgi:hypothetical protein
LQVRRKEASEEVFCVTVPSGFIITRRLGASVVISNCQNWPVSIPGWPPEVGADGKWKMNKHGDFILPVMHPRAQVAAPAGRILLGSDFSALHFRIAALLSGDAFLYDCFENNRDIHTIVARDAYPEFAELDAWLKERGVKGKAPLPENAPKEVQIRHALWNRLRFYSKSTGYARLNESGEETILGIIQKGAVEATLDDVRRAIKSVDDKMAGVMRWHALEKAKASVARQSRGIIFNRARLYPLGAMDPNVIIAHPLHACEAVLQAKAILRFTAVTHPELVDVPHLAKVGVLSPADTSMIMHWHMRLHGIAPYYCELLVNGHDSLVVEVDFPVGHVLCELLGAAMHQRLEYQGRWMDFPAEPAMGRRWSDT